MNLQRPTRIMTLCLEFVRSGTFLRVVAACWIGTMTGSGAAQDSQPARQHALLIGVQHYNPDQWLPLPSAEGEMTKLHELLQRAGYRDSQLTLLTNSQGVIRTAQLPTRANLLRELEQLAARLERADHLLVAFSGHGVATAQGEWYLCPFDADLNDLDSLLPLSELYESLNRVRCGHKLLLVDAMHDQPFAESAGSRLSERFTQRVPKLPPPPANTAIFFSAATGQSAPRPESLGSQPSRFFAAVIAGLQGRAAGADGTVTLPDLERFVKAEFARRDSTPPQDPYLENNTTGLLTLMSYSLGPDEMEQLQWLIRADKYDEADEIILRRLASHPSDALALAQQSRLLTYRAEQFRDFSRLDEAWQIADRAVGLAPNEALPYIARANAYRIKQEYEKALADATTAVQRDPHNVMAHVIRGFCCHHLHDLEGMRREAEIGMEIDPEFPEARATYVAYLFAKGRLADGMRELDRAIAITPDMAALYFLKGYGFEKQRKHREAVAEYTLAIQCNSRIPGYYCRRAISHVNAGNLTAALADISAAEQIMPDYVDIAAARAMVNQRQRGYGQSGDLIVAGLQQNPRSADLWQGRGFDLYNNRRFAEAIDAFNQCLEINPSYGEAHMGIGMVHLEQQRYEEALVHLNRATRHKPHLGRAHFEKSRALAALGERSQAAEAIELALQSEPDNQAYRIQKATVARSLP